MDEYLFYIIFTSGLAAFSLLFYMQVRANTVGVRSLGDTELTAWIGLFFISALTLIISLIVLICDALVNN